MSKAPAEAGRRPEVPPYTGSGQDSRAQIQLQRDCADTEPWAVGAGSTCDLLRVFLSSQRNRWFFFFPLLWGLCTVPVWAPYSQTRNISQNAVTSLWGTQGYTNKYNWPRGSSMSEFRLSAEIPNDLSQNYNTKSWRGAGQSLVHCRGSSTRIYSAHTSSSCSWARQKPAGTWLHLSGAGSAVVHTDNVHAEVLFVEDSQPQENAQPM